MSLAKEKLLLYAVTDRKNKPLGEFYYDVELALKGGVTLLQLREKNLCEEDFIKEAKLLSKLCHSYSVPLIINDNISVALASSADGVHLGSSDMPIKKARELLPRDFIIGATAKTPTNAKAAEMSGADYLGVGAIFPSPTKKDAVRITKSTLKEISTEVLIPTVAIGGITLENLSELKGSGICGVAVVSALFSSENIEKTARELLEKAKEAIK